MNSLPDPTILAIPFFIATMIWEMLWQARAMPGIYRWRDTSTSLLLGIGSLVANALTGAAVLALAFWAYDLRLFDIGWGWWAWAACFILDDLAYYAFHRSAHRIRWFWASHVIHHSGNHYNLATALRQPWTGFISLAFLFRMPLFFIGFPPAMVLFCAGANLVYQYWIHTQAIGRMPRWFEAVMNTPSHHRVHHGRNPAYLDCNYAGIFIIWDRMFGTFTPEDDADPVDFGLVTPLTRFNPFYVAVMEWIAMARDVWAAPWRHKLSYMIREPGWSHDGSRDTSAMIRAKAGLPPR